MGIGDKYITKGSEKSSQESIAALVNAENVFINQSCALIILAYRNMINESILKATWEEETITEHLKKHIKLCSFTEGFEYFITTEYPEDDPEIEDGIKSTKKKKYFDLIVSSFSNRNLLYIGIEAKILIENNFLKRIATTELAEYVSISGMRKFIDGIYKKRGIMIGYVMEGNPTIILDKINKKIKATRFYNNSEILIVKEPIDGYMHNYYSNHPPLQYPLEHLFLDFTQI